MKQQEIIGKLEPLTNQVTFLDSANTNNLIVKLTNHVPDFANLSNQAVSAIQNMGSDMGVALKLNVLFPTLFAISFIANIILAIFLVIKQKE